jgi:hypothetical protein
MIVTIIKVTLAVPTSAPMIRRPKSVYSATLTADHPRESRLRGSMFPLATSVARRERCRLWLRA